MLLTKDELHSLVELMHQSPHSLLGMQPLGGGSGLVVRALLPDAAKVEVQPVHEKDKPRFALKRIHEISQPRLRLRPGGHQSSGPIGGDSPPESSTTCRASSTALFPSCSDAS